MKTGSVQKYDPERGFGFIRRDDGEKNIFFHVSALRSVFVPKPGDPVEFEIGFNSRDGRERAEEVTRLPPEERAVARHN